MQEQLSYSQQVFYFGLILMLGTGVLSATLFPAAGVGTIIGVGAGACLALGGRLWHRQVLRSAHHRTLL